MEARCSLGLDYRARPGMVIVSILRHPALLLSRVLGWDDIFLVLLILIRVAAPGALLCIFRTYQD